MWSSSTLKADLQIPRQSVHAVAVCSTLSLRLKCKHLVHLRNRNPKRTGYRLRLHPGLEGSADQAGLAHRQRRSMLLLHRFEPAACGWRLYGKIACLCRSLGLTLSSRAPPLQLVLDADTQCLQIEVIKIL